MKHWPEILRRNRTVIILFTVMVLLPSLNHPVPQIQGEQQFSSRSICAGRSASAACNDDCHCQSGKDSGGECRRCFCAPEVSDIAADTGPYSSLPLSQRPL